jgi:hypothetical protein
VAANRCKRGAQRPVLTSARLAETVSKSSHVAPPVTPCPSPHARMGGLRGAFRVGSQIKDKYNTPKKALRKPFGGLCVVQDQLPRRRFWLGLELGDLLNSGSNCSTPCAMRAGHIRRGPFLVVFTLACPSTS